MSDLRVGEAECARCRCRYPFTMGSGCPWCTPANPPLAGVEVDQSRGLRPLAPEGFTDGIGWTYAVRAPDDGMLLAGGVFPTRSEAEAAQGRLRERDYEVGTIVAVALPGRAPAPQAPARTPSAAGAASAPEGIAVTSEMVVAAINVLDQRGWSPPKPVGWGEDVRLALVAAFTVACIVRRPLTTTEIAHGLSLVPDAASVEAGPSRGAPAPLAPEGPTMGEDAWEDVANARERQLAETKAKLAAAEAQAGRMREALTEIAAQSIYDAETAAEIDHDGYYTSAKATAIARAALAPADPYTCLGMLFSQPLPAPGGSSGEAG